MNLRFQLSPERDTLIVRWDALAGADGYVVLLGDDVVDRVDYPPAKIFPLPLIHQKIRVAGIVNRGWFFSPPHRVGVDDIQSPYSSSACVPFIFQNVRLKGLGPLRCEISWRTDAEDLKINLPSETSWIRIIAKDEDDAKGERDNFEEWARRRPSAYKMDLTIPYEKDLWSLQAICDDGSLSQPQWRNDFCSLPRGVSVPHVEEFDVSSQRDGSGRKHIYRITWQEPKEWVSGIRIAFSRPDVSSDEFIKSPALCDPCNGDFIEVHEDDIALLGIKDSLSSVVYSLAARSYRVIQGKRIWSEPVFASLPILLDTSGQQKFSLFRDILPDDRKKWPSWGNFGWRVRHYIPVTGEPIPEGRVPGESMLGVLFSEASGVGTIAIFSRGEGGCWSQERSIFLEIFKEMPRWSDADWLFLSHEHIVVAVPTSDGAYLLFFKYDKIQRLWVEIKGERILIPKEINPDINHEWGHQTRIIPDDDELLVTLASHQRLWSCTKTANGCTKPVFHTIGVDDFQFSSVDYDGDEILFGDDRLEIANSLYASGRAFLLKKAKNHSWDYVHRFDPPKDEPIFSFFGHLVALSASWLAIAGDGVNTVPAVYRREGEGKNQWKPLKTPNEFASTIFQMGLHASQLMLSLSALGPKKKIRYASLSNSSYQSQFEYIEPEPTYGLGFDFGRSAFITYTLAYKPPGNPRQAHGQMTIFEPCTVS